MAIDTLLVVVGVYGTVDDAKADYELVGDLHKDAGLIDAYDAAVIERTDKGKTKIVKKHETPTRVGGCSAAAWAWRPGWSSRCFRSPLSEAACSRARRPVVPSLGRGRSCRCGHEPPRNLHRPPRPDDETAPVAA